MVARNRKPIETDGPSEEQREEWRKQFEASTPETDARTVERIVKKVNFVSAIAAGASKTKACKLAGISTATLCVWRGEDKTFHSAIADAYDADTDCLEDIARERAKTSDNMLQFLLKSRRPEKYADNHVQTNINYELSDKPEELTSEEWHTQYMVPRKDNHQAN